MINRRLSLIFWTILFFLTASLHLAAEEEEKILFNGQNLEGWIGDERLWRVENGILIGETDDGERQIPRNSFLILEKDEPADFELSLTVRITGNNNSGIQYRSRIVDRENHALHGYQMDIHPRQEYNGMLYEEGGRGIVCLRGESVSIAKDGQRTVEKLSDGIPEIDLTEWNDYRIVAKGDTVTHWLNGSLAAKIVDHEVGKFSRKGAIGLQLHAGAPMKAEFKDIVLRKISGNEKPSALREEASAAPIPEWIWSRESAKINEQIYLRRTVTIPEKILGATLLASGDDFFELSINGKKIGESSDWKTPSFFDVSSLLQNGDDFQIAVRAQNESGPAGFVFKLELYLEDGGRKIIVSDENWEWSASDTDDSDWQKVVSVGEMGSGPWGDIFARYAEIGLQTAEDVSADYQLLPGFKLERVYEVPKFQGSWVALTIDDRGRLIASDQYGGLFRITPPPLDDPLIPTKVEQLPVQIKGAQGLLWTEDALFASVSVGDMGIYQITDSNGDGEYDRIDRIVELFGRGEHGPHGFTLSPDGEWIYVTAGNHTLPPQVDASLVPEVWDEDQLLPRRPDARGHARNVKAPGGWIARLTPDGKHWELVSIGFRNTYAIAFDEHGELFTYDSDMEWDFGTPWYRPTRINHVTSGSEFGWRHGTGKWPAYYEDSLPAILDIGPGSPTGVVSGAGLAFPERYQRALYMLDWTYATLYAVHLTPNGASYRAETEELVAGSGLPMTDAIVGADGALYFTIGGRRLNSVLYRVIYTGNETTDPISGPKSLDPKTKVLTKLRHELESLHEKPDPAALDQIWSALDHDDRFIRFAARTALEHLSPEIWKNRFTNENSPWQTIQAAIALARTGEGSDQSLALDALEAISWTALDEPQKLNLLRAFGLSFARHGNPDDARRERLIEQFEAHFPAETDFLNRELVRMLVYLESPEVLAKTLRLMAAHNEGKAPQWADLALRNEEYGAVLQTMIENMPSEQNLFYAYCLRTLDGPWTIGQRRQFFTWLAEASEKSGGSSYRGFIADLREETLNRATPEERQLIESWNLETKTNPFADLPAVEGPGRAWTIDEALAAAEKGLVNRNLERGERMFHATLCAACHQINGRGGSTGPDLTTIGRRFSVADLIEAIIDPDREISDQYAFELITLNDGSSWNGKILEELDDELVISTNPFDFTDARRVPKTLIAKIEPSRTSPMPAGLINRLSEEELRDLLAFLMHPN